jgi:carbamate kinase
MGPKVAAACRFVTRTGGTAAVGALSDAMAVLRGDAGTRICRREGPAVFCSPDALPKPG